MANWKIKNKVCDSLQFTTGIPLVANHVSLDSIGTVGSISSMGIIHSFHAMPSVLNLESKCQLKLNKDYTYIKQCAKKSFCKY